MKATGLVLKERAYIGASPPDAFEDESRWGNDGVHTDITWVKVPSGLWVRSFNGSSSLIECGKPASLNALTGNMSVEAWVNPNSLGEANLGRILDKAQGVAEGFYLNLQATEAAQFKIFVGGGSKIAVSAGNSVPLGSWTKVVGVFNGTNVLIYTNLTLVTGSATAGPIDDHSARNLDIGNRGGTDLTFDGLIGLLKICNYALSATQIRKRFDAERDFFGV